MIKYQIGAVLSASVAYANLKVGVISDLHTNTHYIPEGSVDSNCQTSSNDIHYDDTKAPIAKFGCDPSHTLVDHMLRRFTEAFGEVDFILLTGDHVAHGVAPKHGKAKEGDSDKLKANIEATFAIVQKHFSDTLVLPCVGNNDGWHSQAPDEKQKAGYYGYLYDLWITKHNGN